MQVRRAFAWCRTDSQREAFSTPRKRGMSQPVRIRRPTLSEVGGMVWKKGIEGGGAKGAKFKGTSDREEVCVGVQVHLAWVAFNVPILA